MCQAEFAYNHTHNWSLGFSPFKVVYGFVPHRPQSGEFHGRAVDLVTELEHIHALARGNLEASSFKYKE